MKENAKLTAYEMSSTAAEGQSELDLAICISFRRMAPMKHFFRSGLLIFTLFSTQSGWAGPDDSYFQSFSSSFLEVLKPGSANYQEPTEGYPLFGGIFKKEYLKWGLHEGSEYVSAECDPEKNRLAPSQYFAKCEKQLETGLNNPLMNAWGTVWLQLTPYEHPYLRPVLLHLPGGIKLRGLLALKGDFKKRPFVIFRSGLFANAQDFYPERFLFLNYFEQSSFNVLLLESVSSFEYAARNSRLLLGGYDEGLQNFFIASALKDKVEPIAKLVDRVHLSAISHGGAGLFYAAILNDLNPLPSGKVIASFSAYCPMLDLAGTFHRFQENKKFALVNAFLSMNRIPKIQHLYPDLGVFNFVDKLLEILSEQYVDSQFLKPPSWKLPAEGPAQSWPGTFWRKNDFRQHLLSLQSPVLVLATEQDILVPFALNAGWLQQNVLQQNVQQYAFKKGYHCSFPVAHKTTLLTAIADQFVLQHSPSWPARSRELRYPLPESFKQEQRRWQTKAPYLNLSYSVDQDLNSLIVNVVWQRAPILPWLQLWLSPSKKFRVPLVQLEESWAAVSSLAANKAVQSLLQTWAAANIRVFVDGNELVFHWPD